MSRSQETAVDSATVIARQDDCIWRVVDGRVVILTAEDYTVHELNGTASVIWELASAPVAVRDLVARIVSEYDVSEEQALSDVVGFVPQLLATKSLRVVASEESEPGAQEMS